MQYNPSLIRSRIATALNAANSVDQQGILSALKASSGLLNRAKAMLWDHPFVGLASPAVGLIIFYAIGIFVLRFFQMPEFIEIGLTLAALVTLYAWVFIALTIFPKTTLSYEDRWTYSAVRLLEFYENDGVNKETVILWLRQFHSFENQIYVNIARFTIAALFIPVVLSASVSNEFFIAATSLDLKSAWSISHAGCLGLILTPITAAVSFRFFLHAAWTEHLLVHLSRK